MTTTPIFVGVIALALTLQTKAQSVIDSLKVQQLDEVFLSDSKTNLPSQYSGKIVKKITQTQLESMQGLNLTNIIDRIVGVELSGSKSLTGQNISYKVRGGRSKDVVVLVDGVVVSDPSAIEGEFDFRFLKSDQIELIDSLHKTGILKIKIYAMIENNTEDVDYYISQGPYKTDKLNVRSVKVYADASMVLPLLVSQTFARSKDGLTMDA